MDLIKLKLEFDSLLLGLQQNWKIWGEGGKRFNIWQSWGEN